MRIVVITNPSSRRNIGVDVDVVGACERGWRLGAHTHAAQVIAATTEYAALPADLARLFARPVDLAVVNGGDGTFQCAISLLLQQGLPLPTHWLLLPGGTTNMSAYDLGPRRLALRDAVQRLERLLMQPVRSWPLTQRSVVRVDGHSSGVQSGFFFGAGAIVRGIEFCRERVYAWGLSDELAPALAMVRALWGIGRREPVFAERVNVTLFAHNDEPAALDSSAPRPPDYSRDMQILLATTLSRMFLGIRPYWADRWRTADAVAADRQSRALHTTVLAADAFQFVRRFPSVLRGKPDFPDAAAAEQAGYWSHDLSGFVAQINTPWTLDGEIFSPTAAADDADEPVQANELTFNTVGPLTFLNLARGRR